MHRNGDWNYWPDKDAIKKHWEWLRKWLLVSWRYCLVVLVAFSLFIPVIHQRWAQVASQPKDRKIETVVAKSPTKSESIKPKVGPKKSKVSPKKLPEINSHERQAKMNFSAGEIIQPYGYAWSDKFQDYRYHQGLHMKLTGNTIQAIAPGTVQKISGEESGEVEITILHPQNEITSVVTGGLKALVEQGEQVAPGQAIATLGTDREIDFALKYQGAWVDPEKYIEFK